MVERYHIHPIVSTYNGRVRLCQIDPTADSPHGQDKGEARDIVAEKLGFSSGRQVTRAIDAVNKIDELEQSGKEELADIVRGQLNHKSIKAGEEAARVKFATYYLIVVLYC